MCVVSGVSISNVSNKEYKNGKKGSVGTTMKLVNWRFLWDGMLAFMELSVHDPFIFSSQRK